VTGWPAPSTAADLLARRGLMLRRRRRRPHQHPGVVPPTTAAPNDLWTADFKGQFRTGNGVYCFPLTIADQHTRFLLTCHGLLSTQTVTARPVFERTFRGFGLPRAIRTDNGVPFCDPGRARPVVPQCVVDAPRDPASADPSGPAAGEWSPCAAQQRAFDLFRREYNTVRPHEWLNQDTPASRYAPSRRPYPGRLPPLE